MQTKNYTPINVQRKESLIHKAFTYDLMKNRYVQLLIIIGVLIYGLFYAKNYFSKEDTCQREAKKKVEMASRLTGVKNSYILKQLIEEESKKCIDR